MTPPPPLDDRTASYVRAVRDRLAALLGDALDGLYLHGSAALGDFSRARSDVDLVTVVSRPLGQEDKQAIATEISSSALRCPATGLELHVVRHAALRSEAAAPPFELHVVTSSAGDRVVDGRGHAGDPDLVMHFAVLHDHGRAIAGPPPAETFPRPQREALLRAFAGELRWAAERASPSYQVLNACRAWRFLDEDVLCSKTAGGEWALPRVRDAAAVEAALRHRRGAADGPDAGAAAALLENVLRRLERGS